MQLSNIEKKLLMLAMDRAATDHEIGAAAKKFVESLRERFPSGNELLMALEGAVPTAVPSANYYQQQQSYTRPFGNEWGDIMREAQRVAAARMAAQQAQRQQSWEEYCKNAAQQNPYFHTGNVQQEDPKKAPDPKADSYFEKVKKAFGK